MNSPFEYSNLFNYPSDDMIKNIDILINIFEKVKNLMYNYVDNIHKIHSELLNSPRRKIDINKSIDTFKVLQQDLFYNFNSLLSHKLTDRKNALSYSYHNFNVEDFNDIDDYWNNIYSIPYRRYTVNFKDSTKLSLLNAPSIQINLDTENRHFSMHYFDNLYDYKFEINSSRLERATKYLDNNNIENVDIALFNLLKFYESIFNKENKYSHDLNVLDNKFDLFLHDLKGTKKTILLRNTLIN